jgi:two-component system, OmpR family, sensor histidine kinase ChvG
MLESAFLAVQTKLGGLFGSRAEPPEETGPANGHSLREVQAALGGNRGSLVRRNKLGETTVSVAVPIHRAGSVRGALLISTQGDAIDRVIASERFGLLQVFLIASPRRSAWASRPARRYRISPSAPTRSATCLARCAT